MSKITQLTPIEAPDRFKSEKRFLMSTLFFFSLSYLTTLVRNVIVITILRHKERADIESHRLVEFFCVSNIRLSLFNIGTFTLTELIPYWIIFFLNFRNFRQMDKADQYLKEKKDKTLQRIAQEITAVKRARRNTSSKENFDPSSQILSAQESFEEGTIVDLFRPSLITGSVVEALADLDFVDQD